MADGNKRRLRFDPTLFEQEASPRGKAGTTGALAFSQDRSPSPEKPPPSVVVLEPSSSPPAEVHSTKSVRPSRVHKKPKKRLHFDMVPPPDTLSSAEVRPPKSRFVFMVDSNEDRVADQEYHPRAYSGMSDADLIWATRYFQAPAPYGGVAFRGDSSDPSMELKRLSKLLKALTARKRFEEKQLGEVQAALCLELADFPVIDVGQDRRHSLRVGAAIGILLRLQRRPQRQVRVFWRVGCWQI
ncbi:MAG: hypothetical protein KVP17_004776 [Porospora cf. gigantea B]|uniref:uncharacterized protein n=1 Tax=Porospora cf. gigantea B TaxID=2853592 RepID=UPI003571F983|nr:MAG: hypothetical protein KVP17_004776 [Porospora cf. gigantea B]